MNADLMVRNALLAGVPCSGKAVAASVLSRTQRVVEWTHCADRGDDSGAHHLVTAADRTAAGGDREVTG